MFSAISLRNCLGSGLFLFFREPFQKLLPHRENGGVLNVYPESCWVTASFTMVPFLEHALVLFRSLSVLQKCKCRRRLCMNRA